MTWHYVSNSNPNPNTLIWHYARSHLHYDRLNWHRNFFFFGLCRVKLPSTVTFSVIAGLDCIDIHIDILFERNLSVLIYEKLNSILTRLAFYNFEAKFYYYYKNHIEIRIRSSWNYIRRILDLE